MSSYKVGPSPHFHQLEVENDALGWRPTEVDQHEVVQEGRVDLTDNPHTTHRSSDDKEDVETH